MRGYIVDKALESDRKKHLITEYPSAQMLCVNSAVSASVVNNPHRFNIVIYPYPISSWFICFV